MSRPLQIETTFRGFISSPINLSPTFIFCTNDQDLLAIMTGTSRPRHLPVPGLPITTILLPPCSVRFIFSELGIILLKSNSFSKKYNIDKSFNILYSGTLGFKHNPNVLIKLSKFLIQKNINAKIVIVSEGEVVNYLKKQANKYSLNNFLFLPFQDFNLFPRVLASADISLVMLEKSAGQFSVPSKLLSILCSGRIPLVFVSKMNLTSRIVLKNNCGVSVESQESLNNTISDIYKNFSKYDHMPTNARSYAEKNFNIDNIGNKFKKIIR